ncbi:hypothetical protein FGO68_gene9748 [Halteria grandinella]|uniref:Uncharacterized protein n=1 Tax=Halteria grandinella TaxID=5974 RepID=A0A8J8TAG9_HALGN|nr:hypothetical protein FGO68_gene9748 [Halteria grandinella]
MPQRESKKVQIIVSEQNDEMQYPASPPLLPNHKVESAYQEIPSQMKESGDGFNFNSVSNGIFGISYSKQRGRTLPKQEANSDFVNKESNFSNHQTYNENNYLSPEKMIIDHLALLRRGGKPLGPLLNSTNNECSPVRVKQLNWRDFFEITEIAKVGLVGEQDKQSEQSDQGDEGGSESDPSENNMDAKEFLGIIENAFQGDLDVNFEELQIDEVHEVIEPKNIIEEEQHLELPLPPTVMGPILMNDEAQEEDANTYNFIVKSSHTATNSHQSVNDGFSSFIKKPATKVVSENQLDYLDIGGGSKEANSLRKAIDRQSSYQSSQAQVQGQFSRQRKSPITLRAQTSQYTGWSQTKQSHIRSISNSEKIKQVYNIKQLRTSATTIQRQPVGTTSHLRHHKPVEQKQNLITAQDLDQASLVHRAFSNPINHNGFDDESQIRFKEDIKKLDIQFDQERDQSVRISKNPFVNIVITETKAPIESAQNAIFSSELAKGTSLTNIAILGSNQVKKSVNIGSFREMSNQGQDRQTVEQQQLEAIKRGQFILINHNTQLSNFEQRNSVAFNPQNFFTDRSTASTGGGGGIMLKRLEQWRQQNNSSMINSRVVDDTGMLPSLKREGATSQLRKVKRQDAEGRGQSRTPVTVSQPDRIPQQHYNQIKVEAQRRENKSPLHSKIPQSSSISPQKIIHRKVGLSADAGNDALYAAVNQNVMRVNAHPLPESQRQNGLRGGEYFAQRVEDYSRSNTSDAPHLYSQNIANRLQTSHLAPLSKGGSVVNSPQKRITNPIQTRSILNEQQQTFIQSLMQRVSNDCKVMAAQETVKQ